jgi:hypothetical protein
MSEAWQLLRMGQIVPASQRLDTLKEAPDAISHDLGQANILTARGACCVAKGDAQGAKKRLHEAKALLVTLDESLAEQGMENAAGVVTAYGTWWAVEADRCRLIGHRKAELQASRESLKITEHLAADDPVSVVRAEYTVMRRLLSLVETCKRQGFTDEASRLSVEADLIAERRKFPDTAKRRFSLQPVSLPSAWQRFLNRF